MTLLQKEKSFVEDVQSGENSNDTPGDWPGIGGSVEQDGQKECSADQRVNPKNRLNTHDTQVKRVSRMAELEKDCLAYVGNGRQRLGSDQAGLSTPGGAELQRGITSLRLRIEGFRFDDFRNKGWPLPIAGSVSRS
jgi:hypothetical protein